MHPIISKACQKDTWRFPSFFSSFVPHKLYWCLVRSIVLVEFKKGNSNGIEVHHQEQKIFKRHRIVVDWFAIVIVAGNGSFLKLKG